MKRLYSTALAVMLAVACFSAEPEGPARLENGGKADATYGALVELEEGETEVLFFECEDESGCVVKLEAALVSPAWCALFEDRDVDGCGAGNTGALRRPIVSVSVEGPDFRERATVDVVSTDGRNHELQVSKLIDASSAADGEYFIYLEKSDRVLPDMKLRFAATWRGRSGEDPQPDVQRRELEPLGDPPTSSFSGEATLTRSPGGVQVDNIVAHGLLPGHAYTAWWAFFNEPGRCPRDVCTMEDLGSIGNRAESSMAYAGPKPGGGAVANADGDWSIPARTFSAGAGELTLFGDGLTRPEGAEIHLIIRDMGVAQAGEDLQEQLSELNACYDEGGPFFEACEHVARARFETP